MVYPCVCSSRVQYQCAGTMYYAYGMNIRRTLSTGVRSTSYHQDEIPGTGNSEYLLLVMYATSRVAQYVVGYYSQQLNESTPVPVRGYRMICIFYTVREVPEAHQLPGAISYTQYTVQVQAHVTAVRQRPACMHMHMSIAYHTYAQHISVPKHRSQRIHKPEPIKNIVPNES